jgi:hypothetical protein
MSCHRTSLTTKTGGKCGLVAVLCIVSALAATTAAADWWAVNRADAEFDLPTARRAALATIADDPTSADAVAAAGWWLNQIKNLPDPEEILTVAGYVRDPELGFLLARIESDLNGRPPSGALASAELAGPFGVFDTLDLDRGTAPSDAELPPPNTVFANPWDPVRLAITTLDGVIGPPDVVTARGVFTVLWSIGIERPFDGWMAVEAAGSYDLHLDGRSTDSRRFCGSRDAEVVWYRLRLDPGRHRLRADMAARGRPELRVSFYDLDGQAVTLPVVEGVLDGTWASSEVSVQEPPAMSKLVERLDNGGTIAELLLAAALSEHRRDSERWRGYIERAVEIEPENPWPRLAFAWYWVTAPTSDDAEVVRHRVREHLRAASEVPMSLYLERGLALRERREQDNERILETLVDHHLDDVRVLRLWIHEALGRGWVREAEDGLRRLHTALPGSRGASEVELEVLEALERWQERQRLLRALAVTEPLDLRFVDELAEGCLIADAVDVIRRIRERAQDPDLDVELIRLLYSAGELEAAALELESVRRRWGSFMVVDEMTLAVTANDPEAKIRALQKALERTPSSIDLLSLAWRHGETPFFQPYRLSLNDIKARLDNPTDGVDAILVLDQAVERVFADGSSLYYYHGVTRALTPVGARQAARLQQLPNSLRLKVRIHKPDGSIVVPAELGEAGGAIELDDVEPGDLVEEEYVARVAATGASRRGHLPPYIYRFADSERAFGLSEYLLLVPPELELMVEGNLDGLERSEWEVDGLRAIRWRAESVPPIPEERFAPPTSELLPWVSYAFGVTWEDVGDAVRDRLLPLLVTTPELRTWSAALLASGPPEVAIDTLVKGVIDEIEPGRGVLDFSGTTGGSFSRARGNRLGIIAATLLEAGWEVDLVMARTRPFAGTHLIVPTFDSFIMPLLRVELDGQEIWLDLEEERQGIGRIGPILQGSDGLLIPLSRPDEPVAILEELPTFANPDLEEEMKVVAVVDASGDARLTVTLTIRGPQAERVMEQIRSVPTERVPMVYQQMAANFVPSASDVTGRIDRVEEGIGLELDMRAPGVCRAEGDSMVCRRLVFSKPLVPVLAALPTRRYPLIMPVPVLQRNELIIEVPDGWTIDDRPRRIETRWGSVVETIDRDGRRHRSVLRLELPAQTVAPSDYPAFARFCHAVDELNSRPPVLSHESQKTYTPGS